MRKSIKIGKIHGIPIDINYTWFVIFGLVIWTLSTRYFPMVLPLKSASVYWIMGVIAALFLFASLLLHELAHSFVAQKNKLSIKGITLFIFGGIAHLTKEPQNPAVEFKMAIAGPLCSFSLALFFFITTKVFSIMELSITVIAITNYLFTINLIVGIFNLIPGFPLDGGRVLRAALWGLLKDIKRATKIASNFGRAFAFLLIGIGFLYLFLGVFISGIWLIFIGLFLQEAAESSYHQIVMQKALTGTSVREIMTTSVVTVSEDMPLDFVIDNYFFKYRFTSFPVINPMESISGLITLHNVKDVPKDKWGATYVKDAMIPLSSNLLTRPDTEIIDALKQMVSNTTGRLIVTENHKLIGILSQRDVMRLFEVRADLA